MAPNRSLRQSDQDAPSRRLLAIESSTDSVSVALLKGQEILELEERPESRQHATTLLPMIAELLARRELALDELDAIGLTTGPGSFTGLRIGLATVKGLLLGREVPTVGVSPLEAMALSELEEGEHGPQCDVIAMLDARRGEWYAGGWRSPDHRGGLPIATLPEGLYSTSRIVAQRARESIMITPESRAWRRSCDEAGVSAGERSDEKLEARPASPRADWVGRLAQRRFAIGETIAASRLEARYLRRAEAEAMRLGGPVEEGEVARVGGPRGD